MTWSTQVYSPTKPKTKEKMHAATRCGPGELRATVHLHASREDVTGLPRNELERKAAGSLGSVEHIVLDF